MRTFFNFILICIIALGIIGALPLLNTRKTQTQFNCKNHTDCIYYKDDKCYSNNSCAILIDNNYHMMVSEFTWYHWRSLYDKYEYDACDKYKHNNKKLIKCWKDYKNNFDVVVKKMISDNGCNLEDINFNENAPVVCITQQQAKDLCQKTIRNYDNKKFVVGRLPTSEEMKKVIDKNVKLDDTLQEVCLDKQSNGFCNISDNALEFTNDNIDENTANNLGFRCVFED